MSRYYRTFLGRRLVHHRFQLARQRLSLVPTERCFRTSAERSGDGSESKKSAPQSWWESFTGPVLPKEDESVTQEKQRKMKVLRDRLFHSRLSDAMSTSQWKLGVARSEIVSVEEAPEFPEIAVEPLESSGDQSALHFPSAAKGHVTIVTIGFRGAAREHVEPVHDAIMEAFGQLEPISGMTPLAAEASASASASPSAAAAPPSPAVSLLDLQYLDSAPLSWLRRMIKPGMLEALRPSIRPYAYICPQVREDVTEELLASLGIHNRAIGWVFLLDREGRVRWTMHGDPEQDELVAAVQCTQMLLRGETGTGSRPEAPPTESGFSGSGAATTEDEQEEQEQEQEGSPTAGGTQPHPAGAEEVEEPGAPSASPAGKVA